MATALQLIQQATAELGLPVPSVVVGSTTTDTVQQLALLNAAGYELQRVYDWQALCTEYRFFTQFVTTTGNLTSGSYVITNIPSTSGIDSTYMVLGTGVNQDTFVSSNDSGTQVTMTQPASATGTAVALNFCKTKYSFPSDWDRPIDNTDWDKSNHWRMVGPLTAQEWEFRKSGYIATGPRLGFRNLGGYFQTWPPISTADYLGFEYVSKNWARSSTGTGKSSITADTDTTIFPDRLMVLALKLKYFAIKGFDTGSPNAPGTLLYDYMGELSRAKANDGGSRTLSMSPRLGSILITSDNLPDTGYGTIT